MIDTIKLRFHGVNDFKTDSLTLIQNESNKVKQKPAVPQHNDLYLAILQKKHKSFTIVKQVNREVVSNEDMTTEEFNYLENNRKMTSHYLNRDLVRFQDGSKMKEINKAINGNYRVTSSENAVTFFINENGNYIDFEFSIPKYLFGHNLAQFVPQANASNYRNNLTLWSQQKSLLYDRLMWFIDMFLNDLGTYFQLADLPNKDYIEIRRIDLCYNQYFDSKEEALEVFNQQTKINKKRRRKNANVALQYDTTLTYLSSTGSYFKIYHKGMEYTKAGSKDLKRHMEENTRAMDGFKRTMHEDEIYQKHRKLIIKLFEDKVKGKDINIDEKIYKEIKTLVNKVYEIMPYKIDFLKKEMDKVLRYEVSLSGDFFKYCYKMKVFRKKCSYHQDAVKTYKKVKSIYTSKTKNDLKVPKKYRDVYKGIHDYYSNAIHLLLSENKLLKRFETYGAIDYELSTQEYKIGRYGYRYTILADKDLGTFSKDFLGHCVDHFKSLIDQYQIKQLDKFDNVAQQIKAYNEQVERNVEKYNEDNLILMFDVFGNPKIKGGTKAYDKHGNPIIVGGRPVKKPIELLTQTQLRKKNLKKVNPHKLLHLVKDIENGLSFDQIVKKMSVPKATLYRWKKDLELFGIFTNTLQMDKNVEMRTDFREYYFLTDGHFYQQKFFTNHYQTRMK